MKLMIRFAVDRCGGTAIEYALIAAMICLVIVVALQIVGNTLIATFNQVAAAFNS